MGKGCSVPQKLFKNYAIVTFFPLQVLLIPFLENSLYYMTPCFSLTILYTRYPPLSPYESPCRSSLPGLQHIMPLHSSDRLLRTHRIPPSLPPHLNLQPQILHPQI